MPLNSYYPLNFPNLTSKPVTVLGGASCTRRKSLAAEVKIVDFYYRQ